MTKIPRSWMRNYFILWQGVLCFRELVVKGIGLLIVLGQVKWGLQSAGNGGLLVCWNASGKVTYCIQHLYFVCLFG